jgi:thiol-disulfide isomerase/thioredoxin
MSVDPALEPAPSPSVAPGAAPGVEPDRPRGLGRQAKLAVGAVVVAALAALFWPRGDGTFDEPGGFLYDGTGRPRTLAPRLAPVSLVHFWATWCPPCLTEIPAIDRLIADFADRPEFDVVMIAVDDVKEKAETFVGDRAAMMLYDPNWEVAHRYGTRKLPETYLVVAGKVVEKWEGAVDWDDAAIRRRLESALAEVGSQVAAAGR